MRKLLSLVVAAMFASVSFCALGADGESKKEQNPASSADAKKSDKPAASPKSDAPKK
jgi:hypothetical protein